MFEISSIMSLDASVPVAAAVESRGEHKAETVDDLQIAHLSTMAVELLARAVELEEQAKHIIGDETSDEVAHARNQAFAMRATAEQVSREISNAPVDKSGRKKIPATRVAAMGSAIEHVMHAGDKEKSAVAAAEEAAKSHEVKKAEAFKEAAAEKTTVRSVIRKICGFGEKTCENAPAKTGMAAVTAKITTWRDQANEYIHSAAEQTSNVISKAWIATKEAAHSASDYVVETASTAVQSVKRFGEKTVVAVTVMYDNTGKAISSAIVSVKETASGAVTYVSETIISTKDKAVAAYEATKQAAAEKMAAMKEASNRWMAGMFSHEEAPMIAKKAALAPAVQAKSSMGKALSEAMALSLPIGISGMHIADSLGVSMQSLPKLNMGMAFSGIC